MPVEVDTKKVVVGTTIALGSAAALIWFKRRKAKPPPPSVNPVSATATATTGRDREDSENTASAAQADPSIPSTSMAATATETRSPSTSPAPNNNSSADDIETDLLTPELQGSWSEHVEKELACETKATNPNQLHSPFQPSDQHSETSLDSGRGGSTGGGAGGSMGMSPPADLAHSPNQDSSSSPNPNPNPHQHPSAPQCYEFEIPQHVVGAIIGKKGVVIKDLTAKTGTWILIREHGFKDNYKLCTIEGSRDEINACLRMIRRRFPPSRFPDLNLNPVMPPPIAAPGGPMEQLHLPEGVQCEVVVSAMVDAGHVFVQQPTHPTFTALTKLDGYMLAVYSQSIGIPPLPVPVELGCLCAAPALGGWYRATTVDVYPDSAEVLVKFVDYGGYSRLPADQLKQIRSDFVGLPFQATECYLANVVPSGGPGWSGPGSGGGEAEVAFGGWTEEAAACVEDLLCNKVVEARVHHYAGDGIPAVQFFTTMEAPDGGCSVSTEVGALLVQEGHAQWTSSANSSPSLPHRSLKTPSHSSSSKLPPPKPLLQA